MRAKLEKSLHQENIDEHNLLIDPDNIFWALVSDKDVHGEAGKKVFSLYQRLKPKLDVVMRNFRFKTDLNSVYINPTDLCNADCAYCYIPSVQRKKGVQMSREQLVYVLKKIDRYFRARREASFKPMIIYHGSEPLLMKDILFSSIAEFHTKFHFGIQTNALLLGKKDVDFLKSYQVSLGISLDSPDQRINTFTRKAGAGSNYSQAVQAIKWFGGYAGLSVIATITKYNLKTMPDLVRFLHAQKVPCLLLNPVRATRKATVKLRPPQKELTRYFIQAAETAINLARRSRRRIIIGNFSNILLGITAPQARRMMCDISPCGGGRCFFAVSAQGKTFPCGEFIGLEKFNGGNIFTDSIGEIMSSAPFKKIRSRVVEKIEECDICVYRNICGAPCPAEIYSLSKTVSGKSPYCEFYKEIIQYAFRLIAQDRIKYLFRKNAFEDVKYEYKLNVWK
ncbi:MAG: peptide-modifying radical SAM enzyme CbpB [Candidatus Omnitrophota bacterium]